MNWNSNLEILTPESKELKRTILENKILKRCYIIEECIDFIPEDISSAKALINFGLQNADLETIKLIENKINLVEHDNDNVPMKNKINDNLKDYKNLSSESQQIIIWRKTLLQYLEKLKFYEKMLNDYNEKFDPNFFRLFREGHKLDAAINFAQSSNWKAVSVLFNYYGDELAKHRLAILSNFPETLPPSCYSDLLPEINDCNKKPQMKTIASSAINQQQETIFKNDWIKSYYKNLKFSFFDDDDFEDKFYSENAHLIKYKIQHFTVELLTEWYSERAIEIESLTGIVNNSLELIKHGIKNKIPDLEKLYDDFTTFAILVYEIGIIDLQFDQFKKLSNFEKVKLLMSNATQDSDQFLVQIKKYLLPFIKLSQKYSKENTNHLLKDYLVSIAEMDLSLCQKVFENSKLILKQSDKIINNIYDLLEYALACVYACQDVNRLDIAFQIVECLPQRNNDKIDEKLTQLCDEVDLLENHLIVADMLVQYDSPQTPAHIRDLQLSKDHQGTRNLFIKATRNAAKRDSPLTVNEGIELFQNLKEVHDLCFLECIDEDEIYEIFVKHLLTSGRKENFALASSYMQLNSEIKLKKKVIPFEKSVQVVISAAQDYINSSNSIEDESISLAKECLNLIEGKEQKKNQQIVDEFDFIDALYLLHDNFPIKMLPIQIRLCPQPRIEIIEKAAKSLPKAYKKTLNLMKLAQLLRVYNYSTIEYRNGKVLSLIGEIALEVNDFGHCHSTCQLIMKDELEVGWKICQKLGFCRSFTNDKAKVELLSFALTHCDDQVGSELQEMLNEIIDIKSSLKLIMKK